MHPASTRRAAAPLGVLLLTLVAAFSLVKPAPAQAWPWYQVHARHSEKCLDVANWSFHHGADVIQGTCGTGWNQQWKLVGTDSNWWMLVARHSGKCLDVAHMSTAHTANVIQATCWGGYNQQWQFRQMFV